MTGKKLVGIIQLLDVADGFRSYRRFAERLNSNLQYIMPTFGSLITYYMAGNSYFLKISPVWRYFSVLV